MDPQAPQSNVPGAQNPGMQAVQQALMQRAQGGLPGQQPGMGAPMSTPTGSLQTGGPNTPMAGAPPMPQMPQAPQQNVGSKIGPQNPQGQTANKLLKAATGSLGAGLDPQTDQLSKALIARLLQYH